MAPSPERLWGAFGGREASQMRSGDFQETTRDDPNRLLGVPLGVGPPDWGPGASRRQPRRPKRGLPPQRRAGFIINTKQGSTLAFVEMCTPSRREAHIGQKRVPGERESRRLAEKYKHMQKHALMKMCTPPMSKTYFEVIGAPGERQSRRYAELFVVALKGACGSHFGQPGSLT